MQLSKRTHGAAMLMAIALLVIVAGIGTLLATRTLGEINHSKDDTAIVQTLMLARGAANLGGSVLSVSVRDSLQTIVQRHSNTSSPWSFGEGSGEEPKAKSVAAALEGVTAELQQSINSIVCDQEVSPEGLPGTMRVRVHVVRQTKACGQNLPSDVNLPSGRFVSGNPRGGSGDSSDQIYAIPFVMVAEGELNDYSRNIVLQGEYRFTVGRGSFARYALFTNVHRTGSGSNIWFTDDTLFDGPVHTNQYFRFYRQPWFGGEVTSAGCTSPSDGYCSRNRFNHKGAEFYGKGYVSSNSMSPSSTNPAYNNRYGKHEPDLKDGVDWSASFIPLPKNTQDQEKAAREGEFELLPPRQKKGIAEDKDIYYMQLFAGDTAGNELSSDGKGGWRPKATHQYIKYYTNPGGWQEYRYGPDKLLQKKNNLGLWVPETYNGVPVEFNGVIYAGHSSTYSIDRLTGPKRTNSYSKDSADAPPALASFAQITIASENKVRITGDLKYEDKPCEGDLERGSDGNVNRPNCDNLSATNVLGIYVQNDDIQIGHNNGSNYATQTYNYDAPDNIEINAVLMSGEKAVTVEDFRSGGHRGEVKLLGGIIEYYYGGFFTFSGSNVNTGYTRKFSYDQRMAQGLAPPFFPTVGDDSVKSVALFSFGQREQVD